jgi:hypothetical protein
MGSSQLSLPLNYRCCCVFIRLSQKIHTRTHSLFRNRHYISFVVRSESNKLLRKLDSKRVFPVQ